jgi:poly-gamma-glutamate synthesis protein (capsule biosynthesis protein)
VLARARFDIVSTANNHAWDYGRRCLGETIDNLRRVGIAHVGTDAAGMDPGQARIVERHGQRFAFFAVTAIFNQGPLREHEAKAYIADADMGGLARRIASVRGRVDWVVVSVHIGEEYMHVPINATRYALFGAVQAGADVVLGHHTHTPQRVEFYERAPVVMSLGNFVFHEHSSHPWTGWGVLARVTFAKGSRPRLEACPYHLLDAAPQPLTDAQHTAFTSHWDQIANAPHAGRRGERTSDGCFRITDET